MDLKINYFPIKFFILSVLIGCNINANKKMLQKDVITFNLSKSDSFKKINLQASDSFANIALALTKDFENEEINAEAHLRKINTLIQLQNFDEALILVSNCEELCIENKFKKQLLLCKYNKAIIKLQQYDTETAIKLFTEILPELINNDLKLKAIDATSNIGWSYYYNKQYQNAIKYLDEAFILATKFKLEEEYGDIYQKKAIVYVESENLDSAEVYFSKSKKLYEKSNDITGLAYHVNNVAGMYQLAFRYEQALQNYLEAERLYLRAGMQNAVGGIYSNIGLTYKHLKNFKMALSYLDKAQKYQLLYKDKDLEAGIYKNMALVYVDMKDFEKSTYYYKEHINAYSEFIDKNHLENLQELNAKYEDNKKKNQISFLNIEKLKSEKQYTLLLSLFLIIMIFCGALLAIYSLQKRKNKAIDKLKSKQILEESIRKAEENERQRIGKDLHDNMGAFASAIISGVDNLQYENTNYSKQTLDGIKYNAECVLLNLRETISVLNNKDTDMVVVFDQFKSYALKMIENYENIDLEFNELILTNKRLTSINTLHLQALLKEIFHNALKHSKCKIIKFSLNETPDLFIFNIEDNGIGFNMNNISNGQGLKNIQWRKDKLDANIEIISIPDQGTKINIEIKK